jgi:photosystem II stability/assembly factor-like uncharacterized protein
MNTGLPDDTRVGSLAINPKTPATLYAGTAGSGVFRSMDGGDHWTAMNTGLTDTRVQCLAINPLTPTTLYAGTYGGVFRSTDSGTSWTEADTGLANHHICSLAISPATTTTLYAGTYGSGVFRSTDSGTSWTEANARITYTNVWALAINPASSTTYAGTEGGGVFRSTDSGATWTAVNAGLTSKNVHSLTIDPATPSTLYAGTYGGGVFRYDVTTVIIELKIGSSTMLVDGRPIVLEAAPIILNSRTLLPIRAVVEAVGGTIAWEALARKVTIVRNDKTLELWIGRNVAELNGQSISIDSDAKVVPVIMNGRTLLPLRFVAEALTLDVQWNGTTKTVTITFTP